jgi:hypothetical protein
MWMAGVVEDGPFRRKLDSLTLSDGRPMGSVPGRPSNASSGPEKLDHSHSCRNSSRNQKTSPPRDG